MKTKTNFKRSWMTGLLAGFFLTVFGALEADNVSAETVNPETHSGKPVAIDAKDTGSIESRAKSPTSQELMAVQIPIELDYPLLQQMMLKQLFPGEQGTAELVNDPSGCNRVVVQDPVLGPDPGGLQVSMAVDATLGKDLLGGCTRLAEWQGQVRMVGEPQMVADPLAMKFRVVDISLLSGEGEEISAGPLVKLLEPKLQPFLDRYQIVLVSALAQLKTLLPAVLPRHSKAQLARLTDSMTVTNPQVTETGLRADLAFEIEPVAVSYEPEAPLSEAELRQWKVNQQMMDALITYAVKHYAAETRLQELQDALLEILLDARYQLQIALTEPVSRGDDPVRHWFVDSWDRLSPVIRQISLENPDQDAMVLASLMAANDVLEALDEMGPAIGLDISADGLRRLARLLEDQPDIDPLEYNEEEDPQLKRLLDLPGREAASPPTGWRFDFSPIPTAVASVPAERLNRWAPDTGDLPEYLPLIRLLLEKTSRETVAPAKFSDPVNRVYHDLMMATAWQESCWRQYVVSNQKFVPVRSGTGDVGMMQINERVWRGFYDIQRLRWDIEYNTRSGAEVLLHYLEKYSLKKQEHKRAGGIDNLARATYSAYNGGPGQVGRYRNPKAPAAFRKVDQAFWTKYQSIRDGKTYGVARCLGGDPASIGTHQPVPDDKPVVAARTVTPPVKPVAEVKPAVSATPTVAPEPVQADEGLDKNRSPGKRGRLWVMAQESTHYTLQLGAFSSAAAAEAFADRYRPAASQMEGGVITVYPSREGHYLVLYGSFRSRSEADRAQQQVAGIKPWPRRFDGLQASSSP